SMVARRQTPRSLATRVDTDDIVQSVFRTFFRRIAIGHYHVPRGDDLWKLLLVISLNKVRALGAFHRAEKRDIGVTTELNERVAERTSVTGSDQTALKTLEMTIDELLKELPPSHAPIIKLRIQGNNVSEIAEQTTRSKRTVERVLQGFRERLATIVQQEV